MRILVTGGAGFIASHVVDAYLQDGHAVMVIDDLSSGVKRNVADQAEFVEADIGSLAAADAALRFRPEVFSHHAAQIDVRKSVAEPARDAEINVVGFLRLLEACRGAHLRQVIFASSGGAVYGEQDYFPADEGHPTRPASPYGVSKRASELYLGAYRRIYRLPYTAFRYANVYGPRQNAQGEAGVVAIFSRRCLNGEACAIYGDGGQTRDFIYVDDVVRANILALKAPGGAEINIGTGVETDVNALHRLIAQAVGGFGPVRYEPAKLGEQRRSALDVSKAKRLLGWQPQVALHEGVRRTVDFFRTHRN